MRGEPKRGAGGISHSAPGCTALCGCQDGAPAPHCSPGEWTFQADVRHLYLQPWPSLQVLYPPCFRLPSRGSTPRPSLSPLKPYLVPLPSQTPSPILLYLVQHLKAIWAPLILRPFSPNQAHPEDLPLKSAPAPPSPGPPLCLPDHTRLCLWSDSSPLSLPPELDGSTSLFILTPSRLPSLRISAVDRQARSLRSQAPSHVKGPRHRVQGPGRTAEMTQPARTDKPSPRLLPWLCRCLMRALAWSCPQLLTRGISHCFSCTHASLGPSAHYLWHISNCH